MSQSIEIKRIGWFLVLELCDNRKYLIHRRKYSRFNALVDSALHSIPPKYPIFLAPSWTQINESFLKFIFFKICTYMLKLARSFASVSLCGTLSVIVQTQNIAQGCFVYNIPINLTKVKLIPDI